MPLLRAQFHTFGCYISTWLSMHQCHFCEYSEIPPCVHFNCEYTFECSNDSVYSSNVNFASKMQTPCLSILQIAPRAPACTTLGKIHPIHWTPLICKLRKWWITYIANYDNVQVYLLYRRHVYICTMRCTGEQDDEVCVSLYNALVFTQLLRMCTYSYLCVAENVTQLHRSKTNDTKKSHLVAFVTGIL